MYNDMDNIISNALSVDKKDIEKEKIKILISEIKKAININKSAIMSANNIDIKNNNGFLINFDILDNIFNLIEKENIYYADVTLLQKDEDKKIFYGKEIFDLGNVIIINDGSTYTILELILRNLLVGNTSIICNSGYMYGTNQVLIEIIKTVLEALNLSKYFVQTFIDDKYEDILERYSSIDLVICVGNHEMQQRVIEKCKNKIILSGYETFDIYIEDDTNINLFNKIESLGLNINYYIKESLNITNDNAIYVSDIEEAIAQINYNGNKYACAIFTDNSENASNFIKNIKAKIITINTSPTIERILDIKEEDLFLSKKVIYPNSFKFENKSKTIDER